MDAPNGRKAVRSILWARQEKGMPCQLHTAGRQYSNAGHEYSHKSRDYNRAIQYLLETLIIEQFQNYFMTSFDFHSCASI